MSTVQAGDRGKKRKNNADGEEGSRVDRDKIRKLKLEEAAKKADTVSPASTLGKAVKFPPRLLDVTEIPETGKVTTYSKAEHLLAIKGILRGTDFYKALLDSPLGTVFEIPVKKAAMSGKLVHNMLCRMLLTRKRHELWFVIGNKPIRFSLKEFFVLTGLPCGQYPPEQEMEKLRTRSNSDDAFWNELMVGRLASGVIQDIVDLLWAKKDLASEREKIPMTTKLRLCLVVLIDGVLCPRGPATVKATRLTVEMVKDIKSFLAFPWGRQSFELTLEVCRVGSESNATVDDLLKRLVGQTHICLKGFPVALQLLFYAAVPAFNQIVFPDPRERPTDFAGTDLEKIDMNRSFCNKDILEIDENPETKVISLVEYGYDFDGVDFTWKDELPDSLVDNITTKLSDGSMFKKDHWKKGLIDNPASAPGVSVPKKERGRPRKPAQPTRKSVRGRTRRAQPKQTVPDPTKFFAHIPTDLVNDFVFSTVTPLWREKQKRDAKYLAQSDDKYYVDVMNALVNNAKTQNIFSQPVELSSSSAGSAEAEDSSASVEDVAPPKDAKGKGKVGEDNLGEVGDDDEDDDLMIQPGLGPSGLRQPIFDATPVNTNKSKTTAELGLAELMELDQEKEDAEFRDLKQETADLAKLVDTFAEVPVKGDETSKPVGRNIVCGLGSAVTPVKPREEEVKTLAVISPPKVVDHEQPGLRFEQAEPLAVGAPASAIDHKTLGFAEVEEWKANVFFQSIDSFVPEEYLILGLAVPKTIFRDIATKGTHVGTDHMELMLALVWKRKQDNLSGKRTVILDTHFMQHLLRDAEKLKQKRSKSFKWHKSLVGIVNGTYKKRVGNTRWMADVDMVYAPMNWSDNHWVALCIDLVEGVVTIFDCFLGLHTEEKVVELMAPVLETLPLLIADFADDLHGEYDPPNAWIFKRPRHVSQNVPTGDCGPMTVKFIELHGQGMSVDCMTEVMVDNLRLNYAIDIYETFYTPLKLFT